MLIDFRKLFPKYNLKFEGVLHVGANVGEEASVYHMLGIKKGLFIEANPDIFLKLKSNLSSYPEYTALCFAITDESNQEVTLHISNNGSQSSSLLQLGTHRIQHPEVYFTGDITVRSMRLADMNIEGYDFLNMDIQGAELMALRGAGKKLSQFKALYLEVNRHEVYEGCGLIDEVDHYVGKFGFTRVETIWVGGWGDALYIKKDA